MEPDTYARMKAMELWVSASQRAPWTASDFAEVDRMARYLLNGKPEPAPLPKAA